VSSLWLVRPRSRRTAASSVCSLASLDTLRCVLSTLGLWHASHQPMQPSVLEDPRTVIAEYRQAALNAKQAGFDGVERAPPSPSRGKPLILAHAVHSCNGYLVSQFLDSTANQRTDEWGGSVANRCRFGLEVMQALVEVWGAGRVGIKLDPAGGYNDVGYADAVSAAPIRADSRPACRIRRPSRRSRTT
jgi:hypothetical protein